MSSVFIKIVLILIVAYLAFELFEHLILPLITKIFHKEKKPLTGPEGMIGKAGRVLEWHEDAGKVAIQSEIWNAVSDAPFRPGDRVQVEGIAGLILKVIRPQE